MTPQGERRVILALGLVAGACIYAFSRVFSGRAWLVPVLAAAWGAIALGRWLRHVRLPRSVAAAGLAVVGALFILVVVFPSATTYGLPGLAALHAALGAIGSARARISVATAPILPSPGYLAMAMGIAWAGGGLSAFLIGPPGRGGPRSDGPVPVRLPLAAPLPWIILFAAGADLGRGGGRGLDAALFLAAVLVYLLAEGYGPLGALPKLDGAVRIGVVAMAGGLLLPNLVPGYRASAAFNWARIGPQTETTISPLVQIKPNLVNQPSTVLFHVTANTPAYWRLTALDHFDGQTWSSQGTYNPGSGVAYSASRRIPAISIRQRYTIASLAGIWVPAAHEALHVSGLHAAVDNRTETVIVPGLRRGDTYSVVSADPVPTAQDLIAAGVSPAPQPLDLALPPLTLAEIGPIARAIVGSASTPYAQALALQNYLRGFTYSTSVPAGSSTDYLYTFLTRTKAGYCEQFAGSMAVMLRTLGIPARVAVGFLPGQASAPAAGGTLPGGAETTFTVTGKDAHAWPEAFFRGIGWVAFEPTPRSDAPAPSYAPAAAVNPSTPDQAQPTAVPAPTTVPGPVPGIRHAAAPGAAPPPAQRPRSTAWQRAGELALSLVAALALLLGARELRLRLPGWRARTAGEQVEAAYGEFLLRAADAGGRGGSRSLGETESEYGQRVTDTLLLPAVLVDTLTGGYQAITYGQASTSEAELSAALGANRDLRRHLWRRADWRGRARLALSPRPLRIRPRGSLYAPKPVRVPRSRSAPSAARKV